MAKFSNRWAQGVWIGKAEEMDGHLVLRNNKVLRYRTVRRLTPEQAWTASAELKATTTTPWQPTGASQAGQPEPERRGEPRSGEPGTAPGGEAVSGSGTHWQGTPGCQGCLQRHSYHHNVACKAGRAKWEEDRERSLPPPAPVLQEQPPEAEPRASDGSDGTRPEPEQGQTGQKRTREEEEPTTMEQDKPAPVSAEPSRRKTGKRPPTEEEQAEERAKRSRAVSEITATHNDEPTAEPEEQEVLASFLPAGEGRYGGRARQLAMPLG